MSKEVMVNGCLSSECSGRKIIEILKKNPKKDPEKYDQGSFLIS